MKANNNSNHLDKFDYNNIEVYPRDRITDKFIFSDDIKFLRIDVGLSQDASQSAQWILKTEDRGIIGIEPHPHNINALLTGNCKNLHIEHINLNSNIIEQWKAPLKDLNNRYILIKAAIDTDIGVKQFFSASPDTGNSSLDIDSIELDRNPNTPEGYFNVSTIPLWYIFNRLDWDRFPFIETLKIDTEGHEKNVLLSCGAYLEKIVYLRVECFVGTFNEKPYDTATFMIDFLREKGFENFDQEPGDYKFINTKYKQLANELKLGY